MTGSPEFEIINANHDVVYVFVNGFLKDAGFRMALMKELGEPAPTSFVAESHNAGTRSYVNEATRILQSTGVGATRTNFCDHIIRQAPSLALTTQLAKKLKGDLILARQVPATHVVEAAIKGWREYVVLLAMEEIRQPD